MQLVWRGQGRTPLRFGGASKPVAIFGQRDLNSPASTSVEEMGPGQVKVHLCACKNSGAWSHIYLLDGTSR